MLPGGLRIIGVFALAPPDVMKKVQPKLRQVCIGQQITPYEDGDLFRYKF